MVKILYSHPTFSNIALADGKILVIIVALVDSTFCQIQPEYVNKSDSCFGNNCYA
jgi:hypothetical protein